MKVIGYKIKSAPKKKLNSTIDDTVIGILRDGKVNSKASQIVWESGSLSAMEKSNS